MIFANYLLYFINNETISMKKKKLILSIMQSRQHGPVSWKPRFSPQHQRLDPWVPARVRVVFVDGIYYCGNRAAIYLMTEFITMGMGVQDGFSNGFQPPRPVVYKLLHPSLFFFLSSICRSTNKDWVISSGAHWIILISLCIYLQGFSQRQPQTCTQLCLYQ